MHFFQVTKFHATVMNHPPNLRTPNTSNHSLHCFVGQEARMACGPVLCLWSWRLKVPPTKCQADRTDKLVPRGAARVASSWPTSLRERLVNKAEHIPPLPVRELTHHFFFCHIALVTCRPHYGEVTPWGPSCLSPYIRDACVYDRLKNTISEIESPNSL